LRRSTGRRKLGGTELNRPRALLVACFAIDRFDENEDKACLLTP
jgi:hypothetical protein